MTNLGNALQEKNILLESGTNEVEILVFRVGGYVLGINVAKVREVLPAQNITHLPQAHPSIIGCFTLRDQVVPCVSLHRFLSEEPLKKESELTVILTEFNRYQTAFVVDVVERIYRVSWQQVMAAPSIVTRNATPVTAVTDLDGRLVSMLDFEMIAEQISDRTHKVEAVPNKHNVPRQDLRILLADDSATVRQAVEATLHKSGYTNVTSFENGEEAWNWICEAYERTGDIAEVADLLVSDVEMPRVDGLHLTKKIKEHPGLCKLYVLLYSSILTPDNLKKGAAVKADAMITKPELSKIVELADDLVSGNEVVDELHPDGQTPRKSPGQSPSQPAPPRSTVDHAKSDTSAASVGARGTQATSTTKPSPVGPTTASADRSTELIEQSSLWITFRQELTTRYESLSELVGREVGQPVDPATLDETLRVLHSIKSAASVVPVPEIVNTTHFVEGLFEPVRSAAGEWPTEALQCYTDWVEKLADPSLDEAEVKATLADGQRVIDGAFETAGS